MKQGKIVVKDNALIEASYTLDMVEQRILLLAILATRQQTENKGKSIRIHAQDYINTFSVERQTAYQALADGAKGLFEASFRYQKVDSTTGEIGVAVSRWVEGAVYYNNTGFIELSFTSDVIPLISELAKRFTQYEIEQVAGLQSRYSIRLYEMLMQWRTSGKMPEISLQNLRDRLGILDHEYKVMHSFKSRVLDKAVTEINETTDILAKYEQHKTGRVINGFTFTFKMKPAKVKAIPKADTNRDSDTGDMFAGGYTDNDLNKIVRTKKFADDYNHLISPNSHINTSGDKNLWYAEMMRLIKTQPEKFKNRDLREYLKK